MGQPSRGLLERYRTHPDDWKVCNQIALEYTQVQDFVRAERFYRQTVSLKPDFIPARKNLATVTWFLGKKKEAEMMFRALLSSIPNDPVPHLYLAIAESDRRRFGTAKSYFIKTGDLALRNPEVLPTFVEAFLATKDQAVVPQALSVVTELESADPQLRTRLAAVFNRYSSWGATIQLLEAADKTSAEALMLLAEAYDRQNAPERAHAAYVKALDAQDSDERTYLALAAFAAEHSNNQYAMEVLDKGLKQNPGSWRLQLNLGLLLALTGDREKAKQHFEKAISQTSESSLPLLAVGVLQLESGRLTEALAYFERAARAHPKDPNPLYFRALALHRMGDEARRAEASVRSALAIAPNDTKSRLLLGQICLAGGKALAAVVEFERVVKLEPANGTALYQLSLAMRKLGRTAEADRYLAKFRQAKVSMRESETEFVQILKILR